MYVNKTGKTLFVIPAGGKKYLLTPAQNKDLTDYCMLRNAEKSIKTILRCADDVEYFIKNILN